MDCMLLARVRWVGVTAGAGWMGIRMGWVDGWDDWQYRSTARNRPRARKPG
jgi:hypothetical protein